MVFTTTTAAICGHATFIGKPKGRTIRYLRGGLGNNQKKIRAQKQSRKKISCTTNLLKKKIEQGLGVIFKIVVQLFKNLKKVFYNNKKNFMTFPPPPVDELIEGLSGKIF